MEGDMKDIYPCVIVADRYTGAYSGAEWTAWNRYIHDIPQEIDGGDMECWEFWGKTKEIVGKGKTPADAYESLRAALAKG